MNMPPYTPNAPEPVLIIAFRRPDRLAEVLERVRESGPHRIYIAVDGPRHDADRNGVLATRDLARQVDWADSLHLRFRDTNLGCREGVIDAITWFFHSEHRGIIIEDDSMPSLSFFPYASELLAQYSSDDRVLAITGENLTEIPTDSGTASYRFCQGGPCSAWATWRTRWEPFATNRPDKTPVRLLARLLRTPGQHAAQAAYWTALMLANRTRAMDSWSYAFMIYGILTHRVTATPNKNLVEDRGIGGAASHMGAAPANVWGVDELEFPLIAPASITPNSDLEPWSYKASADISWRDIGHGASVFARKIRP